MKGWVITRFPDKMYGFIKGQDGRQYFFHASEVTEPILRNNLDFSYFVTLGMQAEFEASLGDKGPRATNVKLGIVRGQEDETY